MHVRLTTLIRAAIVTAACTFASLSVASATETPQSADAFVNSIGMDTHFNYTDTPYGTAYKAERDALLAFGVKHIRDGGPTRSQDYIDKLGDLCTHGIKHSVGFPIHTTAAQMVSSLLTFGPACVDFVEPANEYDEEAGYGTKNPNWVVEITAEQRLLYSTIRNDGRFSGVAVLGPPLSNPSYFSALGNLEDAMDFGNSHFSTCDNYPKPSAYHHLGLDEVRNAIPTKPVITTETQYSDNASRRCYLPDGVIAKYAPRTIAQRWNAGQPRTYWYEFSDQPTDVAFGNLGFVDRNGAPKLQYDAVRSLIHELADPGPVVHPKPFAYTIDGSSDVGHTLLAKRDGHVKLLLWLEVSSWDKNARQELAPSPQTVTITLPSTVTHADLARYDARFVLRHSPMSIDGSTIRVPVSDSIEVLDFSS